MAALQTIEGLVSGLDITSIIDTIMNYERQPVTILESDKTLKTQQIAAYRAVEAKFLAVQTAINKLKRADSFQQASVSVSDDSVISASSSGEVGPGAYSLRVLQIARNHQIASQGFNGPTENVFGTGTIKISTGNSSLITINVDNTNNSLVDIKNAINNANAGVTATIVNDGTSSNPYRLLITSNKTGLANSINLDISLSGGQTLDYSAKSFDNPEALSFAAGTTSSVSLGGTASYSGSSNKAYSFTVAGSGEQTIGSDVIRVDWTDGTNSGSILVTQADSEVELVGDGADGLKLSFSSGKLTGGDTFQVSTFAPLLQAASDAKIAMGSDDANYGSALVISSETNVFNDVIPGLSLSVKKVSEPGASVFIETNRDVSGIKNMINDFITKYNSLMDFMEDQFTYDKENNDTGVLFTEFVLQAMQSTTRSSTTSVIPGITSAYKSLASIGIRSAGDGRLKIADSDRLTDAIENNFSEFLKLFVDSGDSTRAGISFVSAGSEAVPGSNYSVNITRVAEKGYFRGIDISDPSANPLTISTANNILQFMVDGVRSNEIALTEKTYSTGTELAQEIQTRINADEKIGKRGVSVEWVDNGDTGYLKFTSGTYGSSSKIDILTSASNTGFDTLGLATGTTAAGRDVEGTINGEKATGSGQYLTGNSGNSTTSGLKIKVTLTSSDLVSGSEGSVSFVRGLSSTVAKTLDNITDSYEGSIARRTKALQQQIEDLDKQITFYDERLAARREILYAKFQAMEDALAELQSTSTYLDAQLTQLTNNWKIINSK